MFHKINFKNFGYVLDKFERFCDETYFGGDAIPNLFLLILDLELWQVMLVLMFGLDTTNCIMISPKFIIFSDVS